MASSAGTSVLGVVGLGREAVVDPNGRLPGWRSEGRERERKQIIYLLYIPIHVSTGVPNSPQ